MNRKLLLLMVLILFLGWSWSDCAEEAGGQTASMPVMVIEPLGGNQAEVPGWQPALGQGISEMLIESLERSDNKFQLLETAEATGQQSEPQPSASASAGGETKPARGSSTGSPKPAKGGAASSGKPDTSDTADSEKPDTGGSADSDFTFCGEVTQFTTQTTGSKIGDFVSSSPYANLGAKIITAHVQIVWRIVDTETKRVIKRGITAASASGSEFDMAALATTDAKTSAAGSAATGVKTAKTTAAGNSGANNLATVNNLFNGFNKAFGNAPNEASGGDSSAGGNGGTTAKSAQKPPKAASKAGGDTAGSASVTVGYGDPAFMSSALGKASAKAVTDIVGQLAAISLPEPARAARLKAAAVALKHTAGKVLAVAGKDTIIVSLGSQEGFKEGDQLELYQLTDVKDDKGNVVFTDEKLVGEMTLSEVQEERSRGSYAGDAQVQQGWTVKAK